MSRQVVPLLLVALLVVAAPAAVLAAHGGDISEPYTTADFQCAVGQGWEFVIIRSYCSYGGVDPNAATTMANAKAGGVTYRDIYHFPCVGQSASSQIKADIDNIGMGNFGTIWMDIETNPSPGCGWSATDQVSNCKFLADLIQAAKDMGATVGVYSSVYEWGQTVGDSCTAGADAGVPLWYANWDGAKSFGDFSSFGGWTAPAMKQYNDASNTGSTCGINADADWW